MLNKPDYPKSQKTYHLNYDKKTQKMKSFLVGRNGGEAQSKRNKRGERIAEYELVKTDSYSWEMKKGSDTYEDDNMKDEKASKNTIKQSWIRNEYRLNDEESIAK